MEDEHLPFGRLEFDISSVWPHQSELVIRE
jgi:hypothetical protein